jgi:predicted mannosyl-3-phosphoglycerate phosphatase (HAD superfamily)
VIRRSSCINVDVTAELKDTLSAQLTVFRRDAVQQRENFAPLLSRRSRRVAQAGSKKEHISFVQRARFFTAIRSTVGKGQTALTVAIAVSRP